MPSFADKALELISNAIPVFPCGPDKRPLTQHGFHDATTDPIRIAEWDAVYPQALLGVPTGKVSGLAVVDIDVAPDKNGFDSLKTLPELTPTRRHTTPRGGIHLLYAINGATFKNSTSRLGRGIDTRGDGGYIIWWPAEGCAATTDNCNPVPSWVVDTLAKDAERNVPTPSPDVLPPNWDEVVSAVQSLDPDCSRDDWIIVGMALHSTGHANAFDLWDGWSSGSAAKYKSREMPSQWKSFKERNDGITVASLFKLAYAAGWKRPPPDVSELFKPVEKPPAEVTRKLRMELPAPTADLSLWPPLLAERAKEVGTEVGCDPVVPLMAGLAAVSAAADKRTRLKLTNSWKVPPILWLMTVGQPSDKKTPGAKPMFAPLHQLEFEDRPYHEAAMLIWKGLEARYAAESKAYREWAASPEAGMPNAVPPNVTPLPPEPASLRLLINDATSQKVVHMAANRPRGFLMHLDEMSHFLKKINDPKGGDDRGCWIQGYEGTSYTMDRVGAGTIRADNLAIPIYGNCQPALFKSQMEAAGADGLVQRFVPVVLDGDKTQLWSDALPDFMSHGPAYEGMIRQVFALSPREIECSPEAIQQFRLFSKWCHEGRELDLILRSSPIYMTAMGKVEGTCARLALLLHLMEFPHEKQLCELTMWRAVSIMRQFFVPSLRYAFMEVVGLKDELGKWLTEYIVQCSGERPTVTLAQIRQSARRQIEGRPTWQADQEIRAIMDELAAAGYVMLFTDHPRNTQWTVNPELAKQFDEYRRQVVKAKQGIIDHFKAEAIARKGQASKYHRDAIGAAGLG